MDYAPGMRNCLQTGRRKVEQFWKLAGQPGEGRRGR